LEIRLAILKELHFGDIDRLRRTCRALRLSIDKPVIQMVFSDLPRVLANTCRDCLGTDCCGKLVILANEKSPDQPLANQCWRCMARSKSLVAGKKYRTGSGKGKYCVCRWCGLFVSRPEVFGQEAEYHDTCYRTRMKGWYVYMGIGLLQWAITFTPLGMCWTHFNGYALVIGSTVVSFSGKRNSRGTELTEPTAAVLRQHLDFTSHDDEGFIPANLPLGADIGDGSHAVMGPVTLYTCTTDRI
jgi:hypothetical protein